VIAPVIEIILLTVGIVGIAVGSTGLLVSHDAFLRLHYLGPASSLGVPLIIAALMVHVGWSLLALKLAGIGVLLIASGAVTVAAFGRATAQCENLIETEPPA
jgi:multicomponent Na+:H+ antiporter subunit G